MIAIFGPTPRTLLSSGSTCLLTKWPRVPRGGKREGAGAPKTTGAGNPKNVFSIRLDEISARKLDELGGNHYLKQLAMLAVADKLRHVDQKI